MTTPLAIRTALWLWLVAALLAGRLLLLQRIPMPATQGILLGLTALLVLFYRASALFRAWADSFPLRTLVLLHALRFVGFYFIWLYRRGELPYAFAVPGGLGDIIVAALALTAVFAPLAPAARLRAISIWNVIGLLDILMVVVTAARLGLADPLSMRALTHLPLSLLPTFLVPLIIATHVLIFVRLRRMAVNDT
jgi:hypothetical protein